MYSYLTYVDQRTKEFTRTQMCLYRWRTFFNYVFKTLKHWKETCAYLNLFFVGASALEL